MNDQYQPEVIATGTPCAHTDAHHGIAGTYGVNGCDECGAVWADSTPLPVRLDQAPTQPAPPLAVGAAVQWVDVETGVTDPTPGKVFQILAAEDAYPIVVRWADGALFRHARNELRVVTR